jgi:hypothetical protein
MQVGNIPDIHQLRSRLRAMSEAEQTPVFGKTSVNY